jgi:hypothetical protein
MVYRGEGSSYKRKKSPRKKFYVNNHFCISWCTGARVHQNKNVRFHKDIRAEDWRTDTIRNTRARAHTHTHTHIHTGDINVSSHEAPVVNNYFYARHVMISIGDISVSSAPAHCGSGLSGWQAILKNPLRSDFT